MANRRISSTHKEIQDVRSRLFLQEWSTIPFDIQNRLRILEELIGDRAGDELHRHVVVSAIAALQTYHRGVIVSIVDSNDKYKSRAAEFITEKFTIKDALYWLNSNAVTFGELVSHAVPCNSVADLMSNLGILLDCEFKNCLMNAIDPYDFRNQRESPEPIVRDVDNLLFNLSEAFRLRHIFAHEAASSISVSADECRRLHGAVVLWTIAVNAVLWTTAYRELPLTQYEMNMHSQLQVRKARDVLAQAMREALNDARSTGSASWLRQNHFAWRRVAMDWARSTYGSLQGSIWFSVGGADLANAIRNRAEQVIGWNKNRKPDEP